MGRIDIYNENYEPVPKKDGKYLGPFTLKWKDDGERLTIYSGTERMLDAFNKKEGETQCEYKRLIKIGEKSFLRVYTTLNLFYIVQEDTRNKNGPVLVI